MKTSSLIGLLVLVLIATGVVWYARSSAQPASQQSAHSTTTNISAPTATPQTVMVTYNGTAFSPATATIHAGDTVVFVDASGAPMWVASGVHPTHTVYDGTDRAQHCAAGYTGPAPFDECQASAASYSFTFTKAGTWPYHNHLNPGATGTIVVE